jgi:hypothetical protein
MVSRQIELRDLTGLDFKMADLSKKTWTISKRAEDCIIKHMAMRYSLLNGTVEKSAGRGTFYTFTFEPVELRSRKHVYTISYIGGDGYVEIDPTHLEESLLPSESRDVDTAGEARLDKFFNAITACKRPSFVRIAPRGPAEAAPEGWGGEGPAAAGAPRPDYGSIDELAGMMGKMGIGKKGGRKTRKLKKSRRGRSKKNRFT